MDAAAAVLQDTAVIKNEEILEYPQTNFQFRPTNITMQKVKTFRDFTAFAITVNKQVIYYGFLNPLFPVHPATSLLQWILTGQTTIK